MHAIAYVLLFLVVVAAAVIVVLAIVRAPDRTDLGNSDDDGGGGGGPGVRRHSRPKGPRGSSDPPWWPEFERDFAAYVARGPGSSRTPGTW